jgi:carbamoyl-phosphate synthase large subunit
MNLNILVTGAGGTLAQSIIKALRLTPFDFRLVTTNSLPWGAALYAGDKGIMVPEARDDAYIPAVMRICRDEKIDVVFVGTDHEILKLARARDDIRRETGATVIVSDADTLMAGYDKWVTTDFLKTHNLNYPETVQAGDKAAVTRLLEKHGFPLVVKPRVSSGSRGLVIAENEETLELAVRRPEGLIVQEHLSDDESEYTVGVFVKRDGAVAGSIAMRRVLLYGVTIAAEVRDFPEVRREAERVAGAMKPFGPCNIQLRVTERGPVTFEINPRFSSTSGPRAAFGFNEVEAAIRHYILDEEIDLSRFREGFFARFWDEIIVPYSDYEAFRQNGVVDEPRGRAFGHLTGQQETARSV